MVDEPSVSAGCVDSSSVVHDLVVLHGWVRNPETMRPPSYVLFVADEGRILGVSPLQADRHDVAGALGEPAMLHCGWHVSIELAQLGASTQVRCYALGESAAYQITNSPVPLPSPTACDSHASGRDR
jgi:hypothetical protein